MYPIFGSFPFEPELSNETLQRNWARHVRSTLAQMDGSRWRGGLGPVVLGEVELLVPVMSRAIEATKFEPDGRLFTPPVQDISTLSKWCERQFGSFPSRFTFLDTYRVAAAIAGINLIAFKDARLDEVIGVDKTRHARVKAATVCGFPPSRSFEITAVRGRKLAELLVAESS